MQQRQRGRRAGGRHALTRRQLLAGSLAGGLGLSLAASRISADAPRATQPNIVFLLADDLGIADLSCYGRNFSTPRIDSIARHGALFTQAYSSSPVCSPTRVALITGRYPHRLRVGREEPLGTEREGRIGLPTDIPTLPSLMRKAGYRTSLFGKWHLGKPPEFGPLKSGYDRFFGMYGGYSFYFGHGKDDPSPSSTASGSLPTTGISPTCSPTRRSRSCRRARAARPMFLSLHFNARSLALGGSERGAGSAAIKEAVHRDGGSIEKYREMLESLDRNVGRVLDAIEALGLARDTIVVFTSDNGGERFSTCGRSAA